MENLPLLNNSDTVFPPRQNRNFFLKALIFTIVPGVLLGLFYYLFFSAPTKFVSGAIVEVRTGESLRALSHDMQESKIIRSRVAFESFVILLGGEKHISPGDYLFEKKLPVYEVARRVAEKDRRLAPIKVTIPEGYDVAEISEVFTAKLKNFNSQRFLAKAQSMEGYLFPDTYFFFTNDNEDDVLKYMSENFDRRIASLRPEIENSDHTEREIITMASIIEREAKGDNDRGVISGILWNRMRSNMPLGVDAAPETYKTKGLPLDPISNPGLEAIRAALNPTKSQYFYYLHDKNGMIHYARTFAEHKKNVAKYLK